MKIISFFPLPMPKVPLFSKDKFYLKPKILIFDSLNFRKIIFPVDGQVGDRRVSDHQVGGRPVRAVDVPSSPTHSFLPRAAE